ncbi:MAG: polyprenyl synthetase family protein, partial [Deltaproteobacteria bacterium]|nr:polyprenyl synthetase family protein [Deltaproteobacteria bacterium]
IHDDLPAMDDDDLRRGRPTCHKAYGEATAILAGDSLLTIAFELIANSKNISSEKIVQIIKEVSKGAGGVGMIGGQILDIESEGTEVEFAFLEQIHSYKTGALIVASIRSGAIIGGANEAELQALSSYGRKVGLAFQIADDILNVESTAEVLGKAVGSDEEREKATYPSLVGLKESKELAAELLEGALEALTSFDEKALPLRLIAEYAVARKK